MVYKYTFSARTGDWLFCLLSSWGVLSRVGLSVTHMMALTTKPRKCRNTHGPPPLSAPRPIFVYLFHGFIIMYSSVSTFAALPAHSGLPVLILWPPFSFFSILAESHRVHRCAITKINLEDNTHCRNLLRVESSRQTQSTPPPCACQSFPVSVRIS